jgi:nicotinamide riboside kinase
MRCYALYLYCEPDLEWEPDPQRAFAERDLWLASAQRCGERYSRYDLPMVKIHGRGEERLQRAIAAVEQMLGGV